MLNTSSNPLILPASTIIATPITAPENCCFSSSPLLGFDSDQESETAMWERLFPGILKRISQFKEKMKSTCFGFPKSIANTLV